MGEIIMQPCSFGHPDRGLQDSHSDRDRNAPIADDFATPKLVQQES